MNSDYQKTLGSSKNPMMTVVDKDAEEIDLSQISSSDHIKIVNNN